MAVPECYLPIAWPAAMTKLCLSREILCNTSFFSRSVKLIFTILPQHQIAKLSRYYLFLICPVKTLIATQKLIARCCKEQLTVLSSPTPHFSVCHTAHIKIIRVFDFVPKKNFFAIAVLFCPWNSDLQTSTKCKPNIPGGAEPTDTFQIWILRRRHSLSWLAGGGTVVERTPFHMVSHNGALECATCYLCYLSFRRHRLACSVAQLYCTRFFPVGVPERPCVP